MLVRWGAGTGRHVPLCPPDWGAALSSYFVSFSLREEFLGHSHCCPIPWTPHDNKVERDGLAAGAQGVGGAPPSTACLCHSPLTCSPAGHPNMGGSMQRMNPPRGMGPMGPGPQVTAVCPSTPLTMCVPRLLSSSTVCQSFHLARLAGMRAEGAARSPATLCPRLAGPTHSQDGPFAGREESPGWLALLERVC